MFEPLQAAFDAVHTALFEAAVQPVVYTMGWMAHLEDAYTATEWFLLGLIQVALLYVILRPLEARFPAERWADRSGTGVDIVYTLLTRLGLLPLALFLLFTPLFEELTQLLRGLGFTPIALDGIWPGVTDVPLVSFLLYLVALDFVDYWLHRGQHQFRWWWALHAVHHAQQKMSFWTDDRNHLLDNVIVDGAKALIALVIGVEPAQFVGLVVATRVIQSVQHANLAWSLGPLGRLVVSPVFHRRHHAIGYGHEGRRHGCNFAVLLPIWDMLFGTADYRRAIEPTGIRDQLPGPEGSKRDYGRGFWAQQWLGLKRMVGGQA
ncbi:MAG: sterol desaturase family protein [Burkholderiales bacterium]|jgi:sterol desaturase/sphingolipid hydroxylase (fatty acid hydroxylase superfamily)|nr:sterol desaturase family protein [Burkholderiales bacterium]